MYETRNQGSGPVAVQKNLKAWSLKNTVEFYARERTQAEDLYPSEAAMLLPVIPRVSSMLDVGCAVGNFSSIVGELSPKISYTGLDTSESMIQEARRRHAAAVFQLGSDGSLPFPDESFDLTFCTGVLHHNPDYIEMIAEMFRVARSFVVIDLPRLVLAPYSFDPANSYMVLKKRFPSGSEGIAAEETTVPYVLANVGHMFQALLNRFPGRLSGVSCCGYYGTPHESVTIPIPRVIFTVALLVKGKGPLRYHLQLPNDALSAAEAVFNSAQAAKVGSVEAVLSGSVA